jgi:hypothetical protein
MYYEKMAVTDVSFLHSVVIEFLMKGSRRTTEVGFTISTLRPNDKAWNGVKAENSKLTGKVTGTVLWDSQGCKLVDFMGRGETLNAARYVQTLNKFVMRFVKNVRRRKLPSFNMTTHV